MLVHLKFNGSCFFFGWVCLFFFLFYFTFLAFSQNFSAHNVRSATNLYTLEWLKDDLFDKVYQLWINFEMNICFFKLVFTFCISFLCSQEDFYTFVVFIPESACSWFLPGMSHLIVILCLHITGHSSVQVSDLRISRKFSALLHIVCKHASLTSS